MPERVVCYTDSFFRSVSGTGGSCCVIWEPTAFRDRCFGSRIGGFVQFPMKCGYLKSWRGEAFGNKFWSNQLCFQGFPKLAPEKRCWLKRSPFLPSPSGKLQEGWRNWWWVFLSSEPVPYIPPPVPFIPPPLWFVFVREAADCVSSDSRWGREGSLRRTLGIRLLQVPAARLEACYTPVRVEWAPWTT